MTRRLLTLCLLTALCLTIGAQQISIVNKKIDKADKQLTATNKTASWTPTTGAITKKSMSKAAASFAFTYFSSGTYGIAGDGSYTEAGDEYLVAMYVPADYAGFEVQEVHFVLYDETVLSDVKVWASATLPDAPEDADTCMAATYVYGYDDSYDSGEAFTGDTYIVPEGGCYIGYAFTVNDNSSYGCLYPLLYDYYSTAANSFWMKSALVETTWYDYGEYFGASTISVVLYGDLPSYAATMESELFDVVTLEGETAQVSLTIKNEGSEAITSVGYTVTDNATGDVSDIETVSVSSISTAQTGTMTIELDAVEAATAASKTITIVELNGNANTTEGNTSVTGNIKTLAKKIARLVVEEEFSTTDCGYCPRGITGVSLMAEKYPDTFIPICVHYYYIGNYVDPMYCEDYYDVTTTVSGFPAAYLNRGDEVDPYYGSSTTYSGLTIEDDYLEEAAVAPEAAVAVTAYWNEDSTVITAAGRVEFLYSGDADYALGYVLTADSLTGTTKYWYQYNYYSYYYSSQTGDSNLDDAWYSQSYYVKNLAYNHVALKAEGIVDGIDGSVPSTVTLGETYSHETTFDVSDNVPSYSVSNAYLLQDKSKVNVVALLFNRFSGRIVNAAITPVYPDAETGITSVGNDTAGATEVARYTVDGRRITSPVKGINIVKYSNGKTVKQIIR